MSRVAYSASKRQFIQDWQSNVFMSKMTAGAYANRIGGSPSEKKSWESNAAKIVSLLELAKVPDDVHVAFEYKSPLAGRVDCMLFAHGKDGTRHIVHIELKQWSNDTVSQIYGTGVFKVEALVGGDYRILSHPSQQALGYQQNIENYIDVVTAEGTSLEGHAYCYNYYYDGKPNELFADQYKPVMKVCPLHGGDQVKQFASDLGDLLSGGKGFEIFSEFVSCPARPTKNLMDCAANMLKGKREFVLMEDQLTSANTIFGMVEKVLKNPDKKMALIVRGGPGTGKTVIALQVIAELARKYANVKAFFTTRSSALRDTLQEKLKNITAGSAGSASGLIRTIFDFRPANFKEGEVDVLLVDEAHRICKSSNFMTDKGEVFTFLPQTLSLLYTAKVCVFFIDDNQGVKPTEIGKASVLEYSARNYSKLMAEEIAKYQKTLLRGKEKRRYPLTDINTSVTDVEVRSIELKTQFRCNGSDNFLDWIDNLIYKDEFSVKANGVSFGDEYQFEVVGTPQELERGIRALNCPSDNPRQVARLVAGWCWKWSTDLQENGDLRHDVRIGDWAMPWETNNRQARKPFRDQYAPTANLWASHPMGINQVGCIFSAQGFEVDYVGVIMGPDITYDENRHSIVAIPGCTNGVPNSADFESHIRNIYRVLLSRGRKGCFVYCCNPALAEYIKRMIPKERVAWTVTEEGKRQKVIHEFIDEKLKYVDWLPYYEMRAACGYFGDGEPVEESGWVKVDGLGKLNRNMFVVRATGRSMEPLIHDGDLCVFRLNPVGSRKGKILLVQHQSFFDVDNGGAYSIKKYSSTKRFDELGNWEHEKIVLIPLNRDYSAITLEGNDENEFQVIGEFVGIVA